MTKHKRTYNNHCKSKKRNRFQTDPVVSGALTLFAVVVSTKSILEILLAHVRSHVSLEARWCILFGYLIVLLCQPSSLASSVRTKFRRIFPFK